MRKLNLLIDLLRVRHFYWMFFILFSFENAYSQSLSISGTVTDKQDGSPIPYVNIVIKNTKTGTITDTLGVFHLKINKATDTLRFSAVGYYPIEKVPEGDSALEIRLQPEKIDLAQINVKLDDGPVRKLLEKVVDNKKKNNPDRYNKYSYRKYTKWEYQVNNVGEKLMNSAAFKKNPDVFKTAKDSSKYLPLYFSEQIAFNEVQKDPPKQKSTVIADKTSGVGMLGDLEISGYTSALDMEVNFYDNYINLFTQNFVSPIANNGWFYYKYYLADSSMVDGVKQYRINYKPRHYGDNTFQGYLIVETAHYSLVEVDGDLSSTSTINFLKSMHLKSNYSFVNDSTPFYKRNQIDALFDYVPFKTPNKNPERLSLYYTQTASIDQVTINPEKEIKLSVPEAKYETIKLPDATNKDSLFWAKNRMEMLSEQEHASKSVIDSVSGIKSIKIMNNLANMSMTSYYDIGKIELGPYASIFNTNKVEGTHLFMGARTSEEISQNFLFWGGIGYGLKNKEINGIAGIGYKFPSYYRQVVKLSYDDKMIRYGENEKILNLYENSTSATENNLVSQVLKYGELDELFREQKTAASYEREWRPGLSNKISASYTTHYSPEYYPFEYNGNPVGSVSAFEVKLDTRLSKEEKYIDKGFLRMYMITEKPIFHVTVGGGIASYAGQTAPYGLIAATMYHDLYLGQTRLNYVFETGKYFGKLPYTFLDIPRGNETFGYYSYDFNMLNYLEYVHDTYFHAYFQYHMNGFFFKYIPVLKRANIREVASARIMMGSLSDKNKAAITIPTTVTDMNRPYVELGAGVENILSVLHIEAIWRVGPKSIIDAPSFALKAKLGFAL